MGVRIETQELISALEAAVKEASDVLAVTADEAGAELSAIGNNAVRAAAQDACNICNNLIARLGAHLPPAPAPAPEPPKPSEAMLEEIEHTKTNLDKAIDEAKDKLGGIEPPSAPPDEIADLFDPNLTARQNQEALQKKYAHHMSEYTRLRDYGDQASKGEAQKHLDKAQRIDSGIQWNRPRLAEVI